MKRSSLLLTTLLAFIASAPAASRQGAKGFATRSETIAPHAMACTSQPLVTQVALDILKQGGSATDAIIAANATIGLMEPTGNGIGGDLFAIVWDAPTQLLYGLNGSGRSPYSLTLDHFKKERLTKVPSYGPLPVTVPGCVDGWFALHAKFGRLPMKTLLAPAIAYAREGFPVSEVIAAGWPGPNSPQAKYPTSSGWASAAWNTCTCSLRRRSSPSRIGRASMVTPRSPRFRLDNSSPSNMPTHAAS
jgi:gamma-glutamyltranspeptidase/glutathione hydrolase